MAMAMAIMRMENSTFLSCTILKVCFLNSQSFLGFFVVQLGIISFKI